jgi:hypothetical protein
VAGVGSLLELQSLQTECTTDVVKIRKMIEEEGIYEFLAGLNSEYVPVCV